MSDTNQGVGTNLFFIIARGTAREERRFPYEIGGPSGSSPRNEEKKS